MNPWFFLLKYVGTVVALVYGIYATFHDFQKGGKARRIGLTILIIGSVVALSADFFKDRADLKEKVLAAESENRKLAEARARDQRISDEIGNQLRESKKISSELSGISSDLVKQLSVTKNISSGLDVASASLKRTSQSTNAVLVETIDRMDHLEVYVSLLIDPLALNDAHRKSILSTRSLQLLEDDRAGRIDLSEEDEDEASIIREFQQHYGLVRSSVFANWNIRISLTKQNSEIVEFFPGLEIPMPDTFIFLQADEGVSSFAVMGLTEEERVFNEQHKGYRGVAGYIRYVISPSRYAGFRKHSDLNGVKWEVNVQMDSDVTDLIAAALSTGSHFKGALTILKSDFSTKSKGSYKGEKEIPKDFFKPLPSR